jgi:hypothetical protein
MAPARNGSALCPSRRAGARECVAQFLPNGTMAPHPCFPRIGFGEGPGRSIQEPPCASSPSPSLSAPPPPLRAYLSPSSPPWRGLRPQGPSPQRRPMVLRRPSIAGMGAAIASISMVGMGPAGIAAGGVIAAAWAGAAPRAGAAGTPRAAACGMKDPRGATWSAIWIGAGSVGPSADPKGEWTVARSVGPRPEWTVARPRAENVAPRLLAANAAQNRAGSAPETCGRLRARLGLAGTPAAGLPPPVPTERAFATIVMQHKSQGGLSAASGRATLGRSLRRV